INSSRSLFGKKLFGLLCLARFIDLAKNQPLMCHFKVRLPWISPHIHMSRWFNTVSSYKADILGIATVWSLPEQRLKEHFYTLTILLDIRVR
ncbi:MAG: hypothetical protein PUP93_34690, partial [Rhizonema sp. NSF051]|nr:hypothetical protein [Rhizonema sp. NSF051]